MTEKKFEMFYRFHSLSEQVFFQHSYMVSTTEAKIVL